MDMRCPWRGTSAGARVGRPCSRGSLPIRNREARKGPLEYAPAMTTVREVMASDLITIQPEDTVAQAATVMGGRHVGSALVMEAGAMVGIFTERDILRALSQDFDAPGQPVAHWMTRDPVRVDVGVS